MKKTYIIDSTFSGQIVIYPLKKETENLCFLLNNSTSTIQPIEELFSELIQEKLTYNEQILLKVRPDFTFASLIIKSSNKEIQLDVQIKHDNRQSHLIIKDTSELVSEFLSSHFLGQDVELNYYQSNSQEYVDKHVLEKKLEVEKIKVSKKIKV